MGPDSRALRWMFLALVPLGCGSRETDCKAAQAALRTKLEADTRAAREVEDDYVAEMVRAEELDDDPEARAMAEDAGIRKPRTEAERAAAIAKARAEFNAQVDVAHATLIGAVDNDFMEFCTGLPAEETKCLAGYGAALAKRQAAFDKCQDGEAGNECVEAARDAWAKANPACARQVKVFDRFFSRVD